MARNDRDARRAALRDKIKERAEENKFSGGSSYLQLPEGVKFHKLTKSTRNDPTILNIVPYEVQKDGVYRDGKNKEIELKKGDLWWCRTILVHRKIGIDEKYYICPRTNGKPCPICEHVTAIKKDPQGDEKLAKDLAPQVKDVMNIDTKDGIEILEFSHANFREKLEKELREGKDEWFDFALLEGGYTLEVVFSEETFMGNKYLEATRIDFVERKDYPEKILDEVVNLDDALIILPYEKLEAILFSDATDSRDDDHEDDRGDDRGRGRDRERSERGRDREAPPERERSSAKDEKEDRGRSREREPEKSERGRDRDSAREDRGRGREREPELDKKEETRSSRRSTPPPNDDEPKRGGGDDECPEKDGTFGKDCNAFKACMKCELWEKCADEADRMKAEAKKR